MREIQGSEVREVLVGVVFPALRKAGLYARANYMCCGGCASYGLGQDLEAANLKGKPRAGGVYWHNQDEARIRKDGQVYIGYGASEHGASVTTEEVGELLVLECRLAGLAVEWDGKAISRVRVTGREREIAG